MENNIFEETKNALSYIGKWVTSKEGVTQMRNGCAMGVAGYVVGTAVRKMLYKKSSERNGWYSRYLNTPFAQKGIKADDKGCLIYAIAAMALDTVLTLDGAGVIKLPSFFGEDTTEEENAVADVIMDSGTSHEENNGVSYVKIKGIDPETIENDIDDDEDEYI